MSPRIGDLPVAVQLFFGAHEEDAMLLAHVFAPDAVVTERERLFKGIPSIAAWHRDFEAHYPGHWFETLKIAQPARRRIRTRMVMRGMFPASPLELLFAIDVRDHRITAVFVSDAPVGGRRSSRLPK